MSQYHDGSQQRTYVSTYTFPVDGFAPILNPMQLSLDVPIEIIPGHDIRQARHQEIPHIREMLEGLYPFKGMSVLPNYEARFIQRPTSTGGTETKHEQLPESDWR